MQRHLPKLALILSLLTLFCFLSQLIFAQPSIVWKKALGSSGDDKPGVIQYTTDGGYIIAGNGALNGGNITGNHGSGDMWVAKLDALGNLSWQKSLGGTGIEEARCIRQTLDGGYIVIGNTNSLNDGDVSGMHIFNNAMDVWVVKLSSTGAIQWQRCYGGSDNDYGYSVSQTSDGGFILGASTKSNDGDMSGNPFNHEMIWLIKTDNNGAIQWQSTLDFAYMTYVEPSSDGGYIAVCYTTNYCAIGNYDIFIVKFSSGGAFQWQKCLGGSVAEFPGSIQQTTDGGFIIGGYTGSSNGDVTGQHGQTDAWIAKISGTGTLEWQRALGGTGNDFGFCARQTSDGGYVMAAELASTDGDVTAFNGGYWIVKMDAAGNIQWQKNFGNPSFQLGAERPRWIEQTPDGGYVIDGTINFNGGDVAGSHGGLDFWVVKLDCSAAPVSSNTTDIHNVSLNHSFTNNACGIIATILPSGGSPVTGNVTTKVTVDPAPIFYNNQYFVQRHYDIEPAVGAATATATITLYLTQQDFDNFNSANGSGADLPTGPGDAIGKSNLRVLQQHGTGTGLGNYTGTGTGIDPDDNKIVWNATWNRWEVTFDVNGFSGFFISNSSGVLPVDYVYFNAKRVDDIVQLKWKVENQLNNLRFDIERNNGQSFVKIGEVPATTNTSEEYEWKDLSPSKGKNLYRLKQIDFDNKSKYSITVAVDFAKKSIAVYPNPANDQLYVSSSSEFYSYIIRDMTGRIITRQTINSNAQSIRIEKLVPGVYSLELLNASGKEVVKFVKQ